MDIRKTAVAILALLTLVVVDARSADCTAPGGYELCCDASAGDRNWLTIDAVSLTDRDGTWVPNLLTTSPAGTPPNDIGVVGRPGTEVLFGQTYVDPGDFLGTNVELGIWEDGCLPLAFVGSILAVGGDRLNYSNGSNGDPFLTRPFFNVDPLVNGQDSRPIAFAPLFGADFRVEMNSLLVDANASAYLRLWNQQACCPKWRRSEFGISLGYSHVRFGEKLSFIENQRTSATQPVLFDLTDDFRTDNYFHGISIGGRLRRDHGPWSAVVLGSIAAGSMDRVVKIDGNTRVTLPDGRQFDFDGAFLALPTNEGEYRDDIFTLISRLSATLEYRWRDRMSLRLGYMLYYLPDAARPAPHISDNGADAIINGTLLDPALPLIGDPYPEFRSRPVDFIAHGFFGGITFRF